MESCRELMVAICNGCMQIFLYIPDPMLCATFRGLVSWPGSALLQGTALRQWHGDLLVLQWQFFALGLWLGCHPLVLAARVACREPYRWRTRVAGGISDMQAVIHSIVGKSGITKKYGCYQVIKNQIILTLVRERPVLFFCVMNVFFAEHSFNHWSKSVESNYMGNYHPKIMDGYSQPN